MEDHSYTDRLLQQQAEEQQQQLLHRQAIHPAPSPVPYPPQPPLHHSAAHVNARYSQSRANERRHNSAKAIPASDKHTLRRRSKANSSSFSQQQQQEDASESNANEDPSFRLGFSGLDMPSTSDNPLDLHSPTGTSTGASGRHIHAGNRSSFNVLHSSGNDDHNTSNLLPHNYYHENAGIHHNHNRMHQSLTNVTAGDNPPTHSRHPLQQSLHEPRQTSLPLQRAHTHSHVPVRHHHHQQLHHHSNHTHNDDDDVASVASHTSTASARRRQSSFTPQHQLDRRNSRRRVTQNVNANHHVPNRYYLQGKSVQTEWSSPTRQRRSRGSGYLNHNGGSSTSTHAKPKSKSSLADRDSPTNSHHNSHSIIVLPSISVPNGGDEHPSYRGHNAHTQPPAFPQRRACVQATSLFCSFGTFKWCVIIQIILVIPLCLYVFDAHVQKKHAKQQLMQYNEEHEHILNQMMWMDQAAKKLKAHAHHKHNTRIDESTQGEDGGGNSPDNINNPDPLGLLNSHQQDPNLIESYYADNTATEDLRDSVHKLRGQMRDMQYRIQQNSKARITEKYGEGPIRVYIHPEKEDPILAAAAAGPAGMPQEMTHEIELELFIEDTPHAVSTFLYQIERGHWNRVQMNWKGETTILSKPGSSVTSGMGDWMQTSRLEFLEQFPIKHCEVALVQQGQMGVLSLQINLVEVPFQEQEEVCIGRLLNDRLILPKARGYFMAEFATTETVNGKKQRPQSQPPQKQLPPPQQEARTPPPHEPQKLEPVRIMEEQPPKPDAKKEFDDQAKSDKIEAPVPPRQKQPRLRGTKNSEEKEVVTHQVVPPLEEPDQDPNNQDYIGG